MLRDNLWKIRWMENFFCLVNCKTMLRDNLWKIRWMENFFCLVNFSCIWIIPATRSFTCNVYKPQCFLNIMKQDAR